MVKPRIVRHRSSDGVSGSISLRFYVQYAGEEPGNEAREYLLQSHDRQGDVSSPAVVTSGAHLPSIAVPSDGGGLVRHAMCSMHPISPFLCSSHFTNLTKEL